MQYPTSSRVAKAIEPFIQSRQISGAVTCVASKNKVLHLAAQGLADIKSKSKMKPSTIFWIASMTKPVTGVALLMLQDAGKLKITDPVSKYIPEFADLKTPSGKPANLTLVHCMNHTNGMVEANMDQQKAAQNLADLTPAFLSGPTTFEPGTKWAYSQSGINTAGRVIEIVSGMHLEDFFQKYLFKPLKMKDTTFYPNAKQQKRLATLYDKTMKKIPGKDTFVLRGKPAGSRKRYPAANGGLASTAPDFARFLQMLLNNGSLDGKKYLKPATVKLFASNHTGDLPNVGFVPGSMWGIGCGIVREPTGVTGMLSKGTYGHGGAYGTQAWADPVTKRAYVLLIQRSDIGNADGSDIRREFQLAASS